MNVGLASRRGKRLATWMVLIFCFGWAVGIHAQQIAITFDDLPSHGPLPPGETRQQVAAQILKALQKAHLPPVYGFINGVRVQEEPDTIQVLEAWHAAGYPLGNHTYSHMNLNQNSLGAFQGDVLHNESMLDQQSKGGGDWHWFRFPFLAEGDTPEKQMGMRAFLAQHGYKIAGVTMSFSDYEWNEPYARCMAKGDTKAIGWLEKSYLAAADESIHYDHSMSQTLYGHDIPYVLLMHVGAFDARMLPRLLKVYRSHGFLFVTLPQAEEDPFYRYDVDPKLIAGPETLEGAMGEKHLPLPQRGKGVTPSAKLNAVCR